MDNETLLTLHEIFCVLHPVAIMEFLKLFGSFGQFAGPFREIDKGKVVLYQIIQGAASTKLPIPISTYRNIYLKFWVKKEKKIDEWAAWWMDRFSNPQLRLLYAHIYNPPLFKSVTMLIDGKDIPQILSRTSNEYRPNRSGKSNLMSRKNNWVDGGKIVFLDDVRGFPISMSRVVGANEKYDGHLMKEMEIHKYMDPNIDCVIFDNHFISEARKMSNDPNLIKKGFGKHNFCQNLTKEKNKSNEEDQQIYSNLFSGLRSKIETVRNANLVSKFKRFSKHTTKKVTTFEELYSQQNWQLFYWEYPKYVMITMICF